MKNVWKELKKPFSVLAPMEDVTDIVFRTIVSECGRPDVFFTEFTSVDGMISPGREKVIKRLKFNKEENPIIAQIWGTDPEKHFEATRQIVEMGFDGVDINMGCPVKKIVKQGVCSALIDNPSKAKEIIQATKEGTRGEIPVSVKTRIGFKTKKTEEWGSFLLEQDIDALTIHGRVAKHMSKYPADWDEIGRVVKLKDEMKKDTVIIGNGDILEYEQIQQMHEEYGVDGVMIGRGVFNDPFVFNPNKSITDLSVNERIALLIKHSELFTNTWGNEKNFKILRRFFKIYIKDFDNAGDLRAKLMDTENLEDVQKAIKEFPLNS